MQMVVDIPEEIVRTIRENNVGNFVYQAIKNGTPLPKGHGRLGDLDKIWNELKELEGHYQAEFLKESNVIHESAMNGRLYGFTKAKFIVQDAPTIIDKDGD